MLLSKIFFYIYGGGASEVCCGVIIIFLWILLCFVLVLIISNRERISGQHHKFILIVLSSWPQLAVSQSYALPGRQSDSLAGVKQLVCWCFSQV